MALSPEGLTTWLREMLRRTNIKKGYVRPPLKIKLDFSAFNRPKINVSGPTSSVLV